MPVSAEQERILLNKYKLTSLYPTEWPHQDESSSDDDDEEEEEQARPVVRGRHIRQTSIASTHSHYKKIDRHASLKSSITSKTASSDVGVQKDEPDALGMAPSVAAELRKRGLPVEDNLALRNKFMLSSTSFSPALYLSQVHQNASTEDLLRGLDFLSKSIEQKSASLKVLVESNFERFVRAKATIDTVYTEMRTQGVEQARLSNIAATTSLRPHSRQATKPTATHFRNTSGPWGSQAKVQVDKKKNALTKESEYGVQGIKIPLQEVAIKAEEVWGPALGGREKEETLKALLSALEQHRDIFRLGGYVYEAIKKNDHDAVVEGYRKAKNYADKAREIFAIASEDEVELVDSEVHQTIITARMWYDVSAQVDEYRKELWRRLRNAHGKRSPGMTNDSDGELHMDLIAILLQLGAEENPIWVWINSRYLYLRDKIARSFERSRIEIEILRRRLANNSKLDNATFAKHLRSASSVAGALRLHRATVRDIDTESIIAFWEKVQLCLSALLSPKSGLVGDVLEWYETAQSFIDNKAQKSFPNAVFAMQDYTHLQLSPEHIDSIRTEVLEIVGILRDSITSFFQDAPVDDLSDLYSPIPPTPITPMPPMTPSTAGFHPPGERRVFILDTNHVPPPSPRRGETWEKYAFWAPLANSLSGSLYLARFIAIVGTAFGEFEALNTVKMSNEPEKLKNALVSVRERCITVICSAWNSDAERCRALETWTRASERRDLTLMPSYFESWEDKVIVNVQKIAYVSDASTKSGDVVVPPSAKLLQAVRGCFVTSLYKGLSGMVENAEKEKLDSGGVDEQADPDGITVARKQPMEDDGFGALNAEALDANNRNVRMLITLSNLNHLRSEVIPQLISQFESAFSVKLTEESKTIRDVLAQIDARLFQSYVKPTVNKLTAIIADGIASRDWEPTTPRPTDARPYVYDVLINLVLVHAEVTSAATSTLTNQILSYMLEQCSLGLINAFKLRQHYTLPALMQATLDVEFMAQTLNNYTTDRAGEVQSQIYLALDERTDNDARARLQGELPEMRGILKKLREGTKGEFGCFRRERRGRREGTKS
jgi:exocyst complex component 2